MATVKKSKKKIVIPICIILVIAIVAASVFAFTKSRKGEQVTLTTITTGDIYEKVSATGEVSSGNKKEYKVSTIATVEEVFVKVGDNVKKGDTLASFNVTQLDAQVSSLEESYNASAKTYNESLKAQKQAEEKAKALQKQIKKLNKQIAKLQKKTSAATSTKATTGTTAAQATTTPKSTTKVDIVSSILANSTSETQTTTTATTTTRPTTTDDGLPKYTVSLSVYPSNTYGTVTGAGKYPKTDTTATLKANPNPGYDFLGWYSSRISYLNGENPISNTAVWDAPLTGDASYVAVFVESSDPNNTTQKTASLDDISKSIEELTKNISSISNDLQTITKMTEIVAKSISTALASGQINNEAIAKLVGKDITEAISKGIIDSTKLLIDSGAAVQMIEAAVKNIDFAAIAKSVAETDNVALTTAQLQLTALTAQYEIYSLQADGTIVNAQKSAMDANKKALDVIKTQRDELQKGWTADFDGTITEVSVTPGADTNLISTGIVLENLDALVATISLGEYDIHKVKLGMDCVITTAYGTYNGFIATIAPTATGGSSGSILDNVGSMAGISGLSSLTATGAGVRCTVEIENPDENIIAGFDADVEIHTGQYLGVTLVPIESLKLEKTGSYVYLYNEEEGTVTKTQITTGAISDSAYQVLDGIKEGDRIVATPSAEYEEDTFKVKVVEK